MTTTPDAPASVALTPQLWASAAPIYERILEHPFLQGLTSGSLPEERFQFYVKQDSLYLREYARCLALASARASSSYWCEMFAAHAQSALNVERSLHEGYFAAWGLSPAEIEATPATPTTTAYTSYLLRVAGTGTFEELLGAILPCYWIYWEVGKTLIAHGSPNPVYQRWIDAYASEQFAAAVQRVLDAVNHSTADLPESRLTPIRRHYLTASRYEWMFWDAAYRLETWPV
ncbi:MAG: thiaminase II [Chloroflexi bacterium]|nr:thiaminase II [Chloroflexota bacterium]